MKILPLGLLCVSAGVLSAAILPSAAAQEVTIKLSTANGECVARTSDPQGIHLAPTGSDLIANGVTLSGPGCGGPPQVVAPSNLALTASPSSPAPGAAFAVSWTIAGGAPTSCTGTATLNGGDIATLQGWTTTTAVTSPRTVTAASAGNYVLKLVCANSAGNATATLPVTVQSGSTDACPATILSNPANPSSQPLTRLMTSSISYGIYPTPMRPGLDMRDWANIWGYAGGTGTQAPWPGPTASSPVIREFGRNTYFAAKFRVPAGYSNTHFGQYAHAVNPPSPAITASYSTTCGDFSQTLPAGCLIENWPDDLSTGLRWKVQSTNPAYCGLQPGTDYYLNIKLTDPATTDPSCSGALCQVYLQHTHN